MRPAPEWRPLLTSGATSKNISKPHYLQNTRLQVKVKVTRKKFLSQFDCGAFKVWVLWHTQ